MSDDLEPRLDPYLALGVMALAVSCSAILIKLCEAPVTAIAFWRLLIGAAILLPPSLPVFVRHRHELTARSLLGASLAGVLLGLHLGAWVASLRFTSLAASMFLLTTQLVLGLVLSHLVLGEAAAGRVVGAVCLALLGAVFIGVRHVELDSAQFRGDMLALASAALYVFYMVVGRRVRPRVPILPYLVVVYTVAALTMAIAAGLSDERLLGFDARTWLLFIALAVIPTIFGHGMANYAVRYVRVYLVNLVLLLEPVLVLAWAFVLWRQLPEPFEIFGGFLILTGGALAVLEERRS